jgi:hypothetical protein
VTACVRVIELGKAVLADAANIRNLPVASSDVSDAMWITDLHRLIRGSLVS